MSGNTELADIVGAIEDSEKSKAMPPRVTAQLVIQGIKSLLRTYNDTEYDRRTMTYLLNHAENYLRDPATYEVIQNGMKNLVIPEAA